MEVDGQYSVKEKKHNMSRSGIMVRLKQKGSADRCRWRSLSINGDLEGKQTRSSRGLLRRTSPHKENNKRASLRESPLIFTRKGTLSYQVRTCPTHTAYPSSEIIEQRALSKAKYPIVCSYLNFGCLTCLRSSGWEKIFYLLEYDLRSKCILSLPGVNKLLGIKRVGLVFSNTNPLCLNAEFLTLLWVLQTFQVLGSLVNLLFHCGSMENIQLDWFTRLIDLRTG